MKKLQKLLAMTAVMAMLASPAYSQQEYYDDCCEGNAYCDSGCASNMSCWLPIGALVVAGIIIATTSRHHHHSSSSTTTSTHAHFGPFTSSP